MKTRSIERSRRRWRAGWLPPGPIGLLCAWSLFLAATPARGVDAPGAPGALSTWAPGAKEFLGTSASTTSKVYFTGAEGILTEVFYPSPDRAQNVDLELIVVDAQKTWGAKDAEEKRQKQHEATLVNKRALVWQTVTRSDNGKWKVTKKTFTDPGRPAVIQRTTFETLEPGKKVSDYDVYVLNNPAINNSGGGDNSRRLQAGNRTMLAASEPNSTSSALAVSLPWKKIGGETMVSSGFVGRNDGWTDLFAGAEDRTMDWHFEGAYGGNVAQVGWLDFGNNNSREISFDIVLAFGGNEAEAVDNAEHTLSSDLAGLEAAYTSQWVAYCAGLDSQNGKADDQYYLAAMTLKSVQDKDNGAMVAGLGTPWGESKGDGDPGGYHLVWARDLFKFASALFAAGDIASANKAVDYLFNVQMQTSDGENPYSRKGRFPQNSYVEGRVYWNGTQLDESAMPIILAWKLNRADLWLKVKLAADFIEKNGPRTGQERWEEMSGYSPSTIAAEIAGLVCAASLAESSQSPGDAKRYLSKADYWRNNVAQWTFTTTGFHGNGKYYIRVTENRDPNDDVQLAFGNRAGTHGERYIIDGGFLELVRMGVMSPQDWTILETLPEYDAVLKQTIPGKGEAWFRYNYDGYGEYDDGRSYDGGGRGRLWPIFTAERGIYEIMRSGNGAAGQPYLVALKAFSSPAGFIPEQVWNIGATVTGWSVQTPSNREPGTATSSMRPLSWAMGEYINLVTAMNRGKSDAPTAVTQRYQTEKPQVTVTFKVTATTRWGQNVVLAGDHPLLGEWKPEAGPRLSPNPYPTWSATVSLPAASSVKFKFVKLDEAGNGEWEGGGNRVLTTPAGGGMTVEGAFQ